MPSPQRLAPWLPPLVALFIVLILGILDLQGSSLGIYGIGAGQTEDAAGVVKGPVRPIRSDEWLVRTPWVLAQDRNGLPAESIGGVGEHDAALISDLPTGGWEFILRPHTLPYHLLDGDRALAFEWWLLYALQFTGVYALVLAATGRAGLGAAAGLLMVLSPVTQWWTGSATYTTIGYGGLGTALLLWAYRNEGWRRVALALAAGLALAAFGAGLYPPWQIGTAIVAGSMALGVILPDLIDRGERGAATKRLLMTLAPALLLAGVLFGGFALQHSEAISAIAGTVYPGQAGDSQGGTASLPSVLSAPFDAFAADPQFALVNGTNQSENASGLLYLIPVAVVVFALSSAGAFRGPGAGALRGVLAGGGVLAAWMLLPLPSWLGRVLLLNRVEPSRAVLPIALASVLGLALLLAHLRETQTQLPVRVVAVSVGVFLAPYAWAAGRYVVDGSPISLRGAAVMLAIIGIGVGGVILRPQSAAGLGVLLVFALWQASLINPIEQGTRPLTDNALSRAVDRLVTGDRTGSGWVLFSSNVLAKGTLTASGVDHVSAISPYPDVDAWQILDPTGAHEEVWNRYAHVSFEFGEAGSPPGFRLVNQDSLVVTIDPCDRALIELGVDFLVVGDSAVTGCGELVDSVPFGEETLQIYRR